MLRRLKIMAQLDGNKIKLLELLKKNEYLSPSFISWYYHILIDKAEELGIPLGKLFSNLILINHPHDLLGSMDKYKITSKPSSPMKNIIKAKSPYLSSVLKKFCYKGFSEIFQGLPPISTGSLFLDKGTSPKLLFLDSCAYVAVDISGKDNYYLNYTTIKCLISKYHLKNKDISVIDNIALIKNGKKQYFISEFKGLDYESEIIEYCNTGIITELYEISKGLEEYFESQDYFFRDLAPRNLIHSKDGKTYLIDFENLYHMDRDNLLECFINILPIRVWFSDILDDQEIDKILGNINLTDNDRILINADSFDQQFYNKKVISLAERETIYKIVSSWERKDNYKGIKIYGHLLGRFISDFWAEESEVLLLKFIHANPAQLAKLRAALYLLSRIDQELLLRKKYNLDTNLDLLSENYFKQVLSGNDILDPMVLEAIVKNNTSFSKRYKLTSALLNKNISVGESRASKFISI